MPKKSAKPTPPTSDVDTLSAAPAAATTPTASKKNTLSASSSGNPVMAVWNSYVTATPSRVKMIDVFMAYLVGVGIVQFVYCVIAGNYPFNAFLAGFSATVGQFVLTASLRIQTNPANKGEFTQVSPERAFADFVFGSLVLHFFCVNFIN